MAKKRKRRKKKPEDCGVKIDDLIVLNYEVEKYYGSIFQFHEKTGMSYRDARKVLRKFKPKDKELFFKMRELCDKHKVTLKVDENPFRITKKEREEIKNVILTNFDFKFTNFSKAYPDYDEVYLTNVTKGNLKLRSKKYLKLVELLRQEYGLNIKMRWK